MKCIITHKYSCFFLTGNAPEKAILIQLLNIIQNTYSLPSKLTHTQWWSLKYTGSNSQMYNIREGYNVFSGEFSSHF